MRVQQEAIGVYPTREHIEIEATRGRRTGHPPANRDGNVRWATIIALIPLALVFAARVMAVIAVVVVVVVFISQMQHER